jgi:hypothetical protein
MAVEVAHGVGPEFQPQHSKNKETEKSLFSYSHSSS